jgi:hypothetical protein
MRQRVVLVLTWVIATTVATAIGFAATNTVGDAIRDAGPVGTEFRIPDHASDRAGSVARRQTFEVDQVRVTAECVGRAARLVAVQPAPPWTISESDAGPDEDVNVTLDGNAPTTLRIEIYCSGAGEPRPVVERTADG